MSLYPPESVAGMPGPVRNVRWVSYAGKAEDTGKSFGLVCWVLDGGVECWQPAQWTVTGSGGLHVCERHAREIEREGRAPFDASSFLMAAEVAS